MTIEIDADEKGRRVRVRAAWVVLAVATLIKAAAAAWLASLVWEDVAIAQALGGIAHARPLPSVLGDTLKFVGEAAVCGLLSGVVVSGAQQNVLDPRLRVVARGWVRRSAVAAALVCAAWALVFPLWNRAIGFPPLGVAIAQFVACAIGEGLAMFTVQRRLLEGCGASLPCA